MVKEYVDLVEKVLKPNFILGEIGVYQGDSAINILPKLKEVNGLFVGVDSWADGSEEAFRNNVSQWKDIVDMRVGISWEVASQFPDQYFDMVYIDAGHRYSSVIRDIRAWLPKVKGGGILAGHDYNRMWSGEETDTDNDISESQHCGVSRAVNEMFAGQFEFTTSSFAHCETWWVTCK